MAKQTLKEFYDNNPHKTKKGFLDREEYKDLVDEAIDGIKNGIPATITAQWFMSEIPDIDVKFNTIRQGLLNRAKEIS